jgi:cell division protein FtsW (lipid II flippase)
MKIKNFVFDKQIFYIVLVLSILGLINFYSTSLYFSFVKTGNSYTYFYDFLIKNFILGFIFFFLGVLLGNFWNKSKFIIFILFVIFYIFLFLVFIPSFSLESGQAKRWVNLRFFSFQPAEIIKPLALLTLIFLMSSNLFSPFRTRIFILVSFLIFVLLPIFLEPALSNTFILASSLISSSLIFFKSLKEHLKLFSIFTFLVIFLFVLGVSFWEYRQERILSFLTKGKLHEERAYQLKQTTLAISSGGLLGKGLGKSQMKIIMIPQMLTDSIFSIYAEETGFVGSLLLIFLFSLLFLKILHLGFENPNIEKTAFSLGVFTWLTIQTFLHIISNLGIFVPTGVVLPFFSLGASSQIAINFSLGLISSFKK